MARPNAKSQWTVAFDPRTGNHLSWDPGHVVEWHEDGTRSTEDTLQLIPTYEFNASLTFLRFERGRSSVTAIFKESRGSRRLVNERGPIFDREWSMFLAEFEKLVPYIKEGVVEGRWGFVKNGSNTGIVRI